MSEQTPTPRTGAFISLLPDAPKGSDVAVNNFMLLCKFTEELERELASARADGRREGMTIAADIAYKFGHPVCDEPYNVACSEIGAAIEAKRDEEDAPKSDTAEGGR